MAKRDFYDILSVPRTASADEIKKAHRKLVRQYHPDLNKTDPKAAEKFGEIQQAYDVLSDDLKRKKYDKLGANWDQPQPPPGANPYGGFRPESGGMSQEEMEAEFGQGQYSDVFEQLFGGRGPFGRGAAGGGQRRGPAGDRSDRGKDVDHPVTLTFEQAARGTTLPLTINRGSSTESIEIKVPAGVKDGSRVRIKGRGDTSHGAPGDLFIVVSVTPHAFYKRDGLDVVLEMPISLYESLLGTRLVVPTLDGEVTVTVPPGTNSGAKLRIKGRGVKRSGEIGDQFCVVKIVVPKNLDEDEQAMIHQLATKHPLSPRDGIGW